ncbi:hypothetical protein [Clostridium sp. Marseille-QA1073]
MIQGKILFIEDTKEDASNIGRMLRSLSLAGKFNDCSGIILGTWTNCNVNSKGFNNSNLTLEETFKEILLPHKKPIITNFRAGHNNPQAILAFGTKVIIDGDQKEIIFTESGNIE